MTEQNWTKRAHTHVQNSKFAQTKHQQGLISLTKVKPRSCTESLCEKTTYLWRPLKSTWQLYIFERMKSKMRKSVSDHIICSLPVTSYYIHTTNVLVLSGRYWRLWGQRSNRRGRPNSQTKIREFLYVTVGSKVRRPDLLVYGVLTIITSFVLRLKYNFRY